MVSEIEINARFQALQNQRDNALNAVVLMSGEIAVLRERISALEKEQAGGNAVEVPAA